MLMAVGHKRSNASTGGELKIDCRAVGFNETAGVLRPAFQQRLYHVARNSISQGLIHDSSTVFLRRSGFSRRNHKPGLFIGSLRASPELGESVSRMRPISGEIGDNELLDRFDVEPIGTDRKINF